MTSGTRLLVFLSIVGLIAEAFNHGGAMFGRMRSSSRINLFNNPFAKKTGGGDESGGAEGGMGAMGSLMKVMKEAERMKTIMDAEEIICKHSSGGVSVVFNGMGTPKEVTITDAMMGLGANAVSQAVTETVMEAHAKSTANMQSKMMSMVPPGMGGMGGMGGMDM